VEHPKFEGYLTPNEDEFQKSVRKKLDIVLEYQNSVTASFDYMHIGGGDKTLKSVIFTTFGPS